MKPRLAEPDYPTITVVSLDKESISKEMLDFIEEKESYKDLHYYSTEHLYSLSVFEKLIFDSHYTLTHDNLKQEAEDILTIINNHDASYARFI